jgi:hypothetical protein
VATLLRAAQILLCRRCRFQRWQRFYAPLNPALRQVPLLAVATLPRVAQNLAYAGAAYSGGDTSTRRSNPARTQVPLHAAAPLLRAAQILLGRRCRFTRPRRFYAPLKSCSYAGAASSGGDASTRRSNPALSQVLLSAVAMLLRAAQILLGGRCRFQRWRRFYAPVKSCSDAGAASSGGDAFTRRSNPTLTQVPLQAVASTRPSSLLGRRCRFQRCGATSRRSKPASAGAASSGGDASSRRSNPALSQVPLSAVTTFLRAA